MTKVKNIIGTNRSNSNCDVWLKFWEKHSGNNISYCTEKSCTCKDVVGALVQKVNSYDNNIYVIPLCVKHSKSTEEMEVYSSLVPAIFEESSEKKIKEIKCNGFISSRIM